MWIFAICSRICSSISKCKIEFLYEQKEFRKFSKKYSNRRLSKLAAVPMVFNVSELMVFGLPVILNPIMLIPFILTPVACFLTTFIAMKTGIVPLVLARGHRIS